MHHTSLIDAHRQAQGKLVDFAGWEMPIQYSGVVDEYHTVRHHAGLFDVSHMGRISVTGPGSVGVFTTRHHERRLEVICPPVSILHDLCPERRHQDDIFIYHVKPYDFLVCVNASNREKIVAWLHEKVAQAQSCKVQDHSSTLAQIAIRVPLHVRF